VVAVTLIGEVPVDVAEFVFGLDEPMPITELADSFLAIDRIFARGAADGARLALTEIRQGSVIALLAPYVPMFGQTMSVLNSAVTVGDFVKRTRDALNAFSGVDAAEPVGRGLPNDIAADLAELVRPLVGKPGARLNVAHIKYRQKTKNRTVEVEASYSSEELDRVARNASSALDALTLPVIVSAEADDQPALLKRAILTLQQANVGPAKVRGQTGDRGVVKGVSEKALPVYFAQTLNDLKSQMVGRSSNPFKGSFTVDVVVDRAFGVPKSYTVIEVHGPHKPTVKGADAGQLDLLGGAN
jgi:hypothetical protein